MLRKSLAIFAIAALSSPLMAQGLSGSGGLSSSQDPNNASFFYNLTPSHVVSGSAYAYASYPSRAIDVTCAVATPVVITLQGSGTGNGGSLNVTFASSPTYQLALSAYMITEVVAGSLATNCTVDLIR